MEWLIKLLQKFSGFNLGWHAKGFRELGASGWEGLSIIIFVAICIIALVNIIYFIVKAEEHWSLIYVPLCLFYVAFNAVFHFFVTCLFMVIAGPWGLVGIGIAYLIFMLVFHGIQADNYSEVPGYFGLILFVLKYSEVFDNTQDYNSRMKKQYEKFLNIKYE